MYELIKSLHIIFVITWFSGLFYIVRLFVYAQESLERNNEADQTTLIPQLLLMQKRLWLGITWPSAILTAVFGPLMLWQYGGLDSWIKIKLLIVLFLYIYHFYCHKIYLEHQSRKRSMSSFRLRLFNELATVFLFLIVFLAVFKDSMSIMQGVTLGAFVCFLLGLAVYIFKKRSQRKE